jgi:hypothetical protein
MDVRQRDIRETLLYGTWWHSTIPSLDPVGLTWQKQSAAELDAEEVFLRLCLLLLPMARPNLKMQTNSWQEEEGKKLKYTDDKPLEQDKPPLRYEGIARDRAMCRDVHRNACVCARRTVAASVHHQSLWGRSPQSAVGRRSTLARSRHASPGACSCAICMQAVRSDSSFKLAAAREWRAMRVTAPPANRCRRARRPGRLPAQVKIRRIGPGWGRGW